jgi:DNA-binding NtrC family response regulator
MPDMKGGEVFDRLKEINPEVKVLLSSGYSIDGEASQILERGAKGFLQKPFDVERLSHSIGAILGNNLI